MSRVKTLVVVGIAASLLVATITVNSALAWHPKGVIVKKVQNQTSKSALSDANTEKTAVSAKPGDVLKYVIEVRNDGKPDSRGHNDMHYTEMTDTLPAGVELVNNPSQRTIKENLGVIKPGQKVVKEYLVKVTSTNDGDLINNTACFEGDSKVRDAKQKGCDKAITTVNVPKTPPKEEPKPEAPKEEVPQVLPATGPEAILGSAASIGALGYGVQAYARSKRNLDTARKR